MTRISAHSDDFLRERISAHLDAAAGIFVQLVQQDVTPEKYTVFTSKHLLTVKIAAMPQIKPYFAPFPV